MQPRGGDTHVRQPQPDTHALPERPLASVMVPVHDVERYLPQCVDSMLAQDYDSIDVVLLDDGSTDGCAALCDTYAAQDPRVRAVHVTNGGLATARNRCLDLARGDLLLFVDADDWIEPNTVSTLVKTMLQTEADIVSCRRCTEWFDHSAAPATSTETHVLEGPDILRGLLKDGKMAIEAWGKLFRPHLFDHVRYPDGMLYEDIRTTHRICMAADRAACIPDVLFHYRMREGTIARSHDAKNLVEYWHATLRQHNDAISVDDSLHDAMVRRCIYAIMRVWGWWITVPEDGRRQHLSVTRAVR